jgi:hypothetical protein
MKKLLSIPALLLLAGCPSLSKAAEPTAPIDAAAVAPLWSIVLDRHDEMIDSGGHPEVWKLDSDMLRAILDKALGK